MNFTFHKQFGISPHTPQHLYPIPPDWLPNSRVLSLLLHPTLSTPTPDTRTHMSSPSSYNQTSLTPPHDLLPNTHVLSLFLNPTLSIPPNHHNARVLSIHLHPLSPPPPPYHHNTYVLSTLLHPTLIYKRPSRWPKLGFPVITCRMGEGKADSKRDGKTTHRNGQD